MSSPLVLTLLDVVTPAGGTVPLTLQAFPPDVAAGADRPIVSGGLVLGQESEWVPPPDGETLWRIQVRIWSLERYSGTRHD
jgi:hypothetical protein